MLHYSENLKKIYPDIGGNYDYTLECFSIGRLDGNDGDRPRPAMLVLPGGGYRWCSEREASPVAAAFVAKGFNCYVLIYSGVNDAPDSRFPDHLLQAAAAIDYIKTKAKDHFTDADNISVCGFSAGGHLAGLISNLFDCDSVKKAFPGKSADYFRPHAAVLGYPVTTSDDRYYHRDSFVNLTGGDEKLIKKLSLEKCVTKNTPPTFIWHTADDGCVDVRGTLLYAAALKDNGVPFELHVYPYGPHGLALANESTFVGSSAYVDHGISEWVENAARFVLSGK